MSVVCVEIGGSGVETVVFDDHDRHQRLDGVHAPLDVRVLVAVPGLVSGNRVLHASNLGWLDVEPLRALGVERSADLVLNDAEAAALGEVELRHDQGVTSAVFLGLGTGVGGAVVDGDRLVAGNLFGHQVGFSTDTCACRRVGCLETVAGGWALPTPLTEGHRARLAQACAQAIRRELLATPELVVVAGGLARNHPDIVERIASLLPERRVERSAAPGDVKSAAAWGLRLADRTSAPAAS